MAHRVNVCFPSIKMTPNTPNPPNSCLSQRRGWERGELWPLNETQCQPYRPKNRCTWILYIGLYTYIPLYSSDDQSQEIIKSQYLPPELQEEFSPFKGLFFSITIIFFSFSFFFSNYIHRFDNLLPIKHKATIKHKTAYLGDNIYN